MVIGVPITSVIVVVIGAAVVSAVVNGRIGVRRTIIRTVIDGGVHTPVVGAAVVGRRVPVIGAAVVSGTDPTVSGSCYRWWIASVHSVAGGECQGSDAEQGGGEDVQGSFHGGERVRLNVISG
jgi:hypothetical protein